MTLLAFIASALLELAAIVTRPTPIPCAPAATCPSGWWLATGVQRSGEFACWLDVDREDWPARDKPHRAVLGWHVCCDDGAVPVQDGTRVWCKGGPTS